MEFRAIDRIPPLPRTAPAERIGDLAGVFSVELRRQAREDDGAQHRKASRGLEDEENTAEREEQPAEESSPGAPRISFFA